MGLPLEKLEKFVLIGWCNGNQQSHSMRVRELKLQVFIKNARQPLRPLAQQRHGKRNIAHLKEERENFLPLLFCFSMILGCNIVPNVV